MLIKSLNFNRIASIIKSFHRARVLVVGDLILDEFIWGKVNRISPEAPVPVVLADSENFMPGGASNVACNIRALGGQVALAGIVGRDLKGDLLKNLLEQKGVDCSGVFADEQRPTTQKTRIIAHHQQVVRIDREKNFPVSDVLTNKIIDYTLSHLHEFDAVVLEDYGKGVVLPKLVERIVRAAKKRKKIITVDPKETHIRYYKGATTITPNHHEASNASGILIKDKNSLEKAGYKLLKLLDCESVLITLGENGMCLFKKGQRPVKIDTIAQDVFDVSGAGDTVISAYTLARAMKANAAEAAHISNCAAGIVVGKVGVAVTTTDELIARIRMEMKR